MKVSLLNSGSAGNCCIVRSSKTTLMIDCGSPTQKYLKQAMNEVSVSVSDLDAVLITHNHSDHIRWLNMVRKVPVYSYCPLVCRNTKKEELYINHHLIVPDEIFEINDFTIQTLGLSHDAGNTLGYVITLNTTGEKLVYVTDTGYFPMSYQAEIAGADYYIFESNHDPDMLLKTSRPMMTKQRILSDVGHLCNQDSANLLAGAVTKRTRKIVLAHLSREANTENLALEALENALHEKGYCLQDFDAEAAGQFDITEFGELEEGSAAQANPASLENDSDLQKSADESEESPQTSDFKRTEEPKELSPVSDVQENGPGSKSEVLKAEPGQKEDGEQKEDPEQPAGFRIISMPEKAKSALLPAPDPEKEKEKRQEEQKKQLNHFFDSIGQLFD